MVAGSREVTRHTDAPGRRRRARWVQAIMVLASVGITLLTIPVVVGDEPIHAGVIVLVLAGLLAGATFAFMYRLGRLGNALELHEAGIEVRTSKHSMYVPWSAVAEIARERCGPYRGPTLLLDRHIPMLRSDDDLFLQVITLSPEADHVMVDCVSLVPFLDGPLEGSPIADDLRRHVPEVIDGLRGL